MPEVLNVVGADEFSLKRWDLPQQVGPYSTISGPIIVVYFIGGCSHKQTSSVLSQSVYQSVIMEQTYVNFGARLEWKYF